MNLGGIAPLTAELAALERLKETFKLISTSSIGVTLAHMTSQNGGQDGRDGSKMADSNPRGPPWLRPSPVKGYDL